MGKAASFVRQAVAALRGKGGAGWHGDAGPAGVSFLPYPETECACIHLAICLGRLVFSLLIIRGEEEA